MKYLKNETIKKYSISKKAMIMAVLLSVILSFPAYAGEWQKNDDLWKYLQDGGGYAKNGWYQIDGIWYSFDENGIMRADTVTPDGYVVGFDGSWIASVSPSDRMIKLEENAKVFGRMKKVLYSYEWLSEERTAYVLELSYSVSVSGGMELVADGNTYKEIQLVSDELFKDNYNEKNVLVTGIAYEGITSWYIRDVAMTVESIREISN
ncbi:MAG: hypothetical protein LBS02_00870 [Hungatella sp.]|jgi:hypothetical protein|nr:hypothetical protein [Hungatella sp.]